MSEDVWDLIGTSYSEDLDVAYLMYRRDTNFQQICLRRTDLYRYLKSDKPLSQISKVSDWVLNDLLLLSKNPESLDKLLDADLHHESTPVSEVLNQPQTNP